MLSMFMRKRIDGALARLARAERLRKAEAIQKAYEDLFVLCYQYHLDLPALLREAESRRHTQAA